MQEKCRENSLTEGEGKRSQRKLQEEGKADI